VSTGDWIQAATLIAVAVALLLSSRQNREVARQTRALSEQNTLIDASLRHGAYQAMVSQAHGLRLAIVRDNPELLAWHLSCRGLTPGDRDQNVRLLFILLKLDSHELNFVSHSEGLLTDDVWAGWLNVLKADFADVDFLNAWGPVRHLYAPSFAAFVDTLIRESGQPPELRQVA
jgi:hypothetical protein